MSRLPPQSPLYGICRFLTGVYLKVGWRLRARGTENVPLQGRIIIAPNHRSYADPPIIGVVLQRPVHFLAKAELFKFRPFGWLISRLNAHSLNRQGGTSAFKMAKQLLEEGHAVIVFPEGKRSKTDDFLPPKPGIGLLASMTDTPVVPAYIHDSGYMTFFRRITVIFGAPILPRNYSSPQEMAEAIIGRLKDLRAGFTQNS